MVSASCQSDHNKFFVAFCKILCPSLTVFHKSRQLKSALLYFRLPLKTTLLKDIPLKEPPLKTLLSKRAPSKKAPLKNTSLLLYRFDILPMIIMVKSRPAVPPINSSTGTFSHLHVLFQISFSSSSIERKATNILSFDA